MLFLNNRFLLNGIRAENFCNFTDKHVTLLVIFRINFKFNALYRTKLMQYLLILNLKS